MRLRDASNRITGSCRAGYEPQGSELGRRQLRERCPPRAGVVLEALDAGDEVLRDGAQGDLRRQIELVREARDAEKQGSQGALGRCPVTGGDRRLELVLVLAHQGDRLVVLALFAAR